MKEDLVEFDALPDAAHVRVQVVARLYGCSVETIWRHSSKGLIPKPVSFGPRITAWNVGELRRAMAEARESRECA